MAKIVSGLLVALITPFDESGSVIGSAASTLVDAYIEEGVDGLYMLGYTGEGAYMTVEQRKLWAGAVIAACAHRVPVFVHVGYSSEADAVELAKHAVAAGADAISSVPRANDNRFDTNIEYFKKLTALSDTPFYIYWNRNMVGDEANRRVEAEDLIEKMSQVPHFAGIKYTDTDLYYMERLKTHKPDLNVLTGMDAMCIAGGLMGSDGSIGALQAVTCRHMKTMWTRFKSGDLRGAFELQVRANNLYEYINRPEVGVMPSIKAIMRRNGLPAGVTSPKSADRPLAEGIAQRLFSIYDANIIR